MSGRRCPACGETKDDDAFWNGARRCRQCVAEASGAQRSARAAAHRARMQRDYGVRVALSERKFRVHEAQARKAAAAAVPLSGRDRVAAGVTLLLPVCILGAIGTMFGGASVLGIDEGSTTLFAGVLFGSGLGVMTLQERLSEPRWRAVADVADKILRDRLTLAESELLEYARFYTTPEWRLMRESVIARDGNVCRRCCREVAERELTVDHIRPRSRFPELALALSNLQVLCRSCNSAKGARVA